MTMLGTTGEKRALSLSLSLSLSLLVWGNFAAFLHFISSPNARTTANTPLRAVALSTTKEEAFSRPQRVLLLPVRIYSREKRWFWCSVRFATMVVVFGNINTKRRSGNPCELCRDEIQNETLIQSNPDRKRPKLFHRRTHRPREINSGGQIDGTVPGNRE